MFFSFSNFLKNEQGVSLLSSLVLQPKKLKISYTYKKTTTRPEI
ncbi:hypothetical protein FM106_04225 [Brachybacterium faecium]|nr:hypothetical protein FM106_04225 [Brachybacterium faecium]